MSEYGKLVRDGIPAIIAANGETPITRILDDEEYEVALRSKILEEAEEFFYNPTDEEAADLRQALDDYIALKGIARAVAQAQDDKAAARGTFAGRIFLESVE